MDSIRTSTEMFPLVENWLQSGLTQKAFSLRHHLPVHVFVYWVNRYRKAQPASSTGGGASGFIRLSTPLANTAADMAVELPSGLVIRFSSLVPVAYLLELVEGCSR
jgi:transposase